MVFWSLLNWIFSVFFLFLKVPHPTAVESIVEEWCTEGLPSLNDPGFVEVGVEAGFFKRFGGGFGKGCRKYQQLEISHCENKQHKKGLIARKKQRRNYLKPRSVR